VPVPTIAPKIEWLYSKAQSTVVPARHDAHHVPGVCGSLLTCDDREAYGNTVCTMLDVPSLKPIL